MPDGNIQGLSTPTTGPSPPPGLINNAPPDPTVPPVSGTVGVTPQVQTAPTAVASTYTPTTTSVTPEQTVSGQIKNIIAAGSPLMQQAEANAKNAMQSRGLINSTIGIGAGQGAVLAAATPIATADAATYAKTASDNTAAKNAALAAGAQAQTATSATNAQIGGSSNIAQLQADTTMQATYANISSAKDLQSMQGNIQQVIAKLQSDTTLTAGDRANATSQLIANIQSNTALTVQDKASAAQQAIAAANAASAQAIASLQADSASSIADKQAASAAAVAKMNNDTSKAVQTMVNAGNLATVQANGDINKQITQLTNDNKTLLETNTNAANIYSNTIAAMANIQTNKDLSADQKATALNNQVAALNDGLASVQGIANNTTVTSTLNFTSPDAPTPQYDPTQYSY